MLKRIFKDGRVWSTLLLIAVLGGILAAMVRPGSAARLGRLLSGGEMPRSLYAVLGGALAAFLIYLAWAIHDIQRGSRESWRHLRSVRYMLDVEEELFQAPAGAGQFHTALKKAADYLNAERAFVWAEDCLKPQQQRWWSSGETEVMKRGTHYQAIFPALLGRLSEQGAVVCRSVDGRSEPPEVRALCRDFGTESVMIVPVKRRDNSIRGILGVVGARRDWLDAAPLEQVALSFSMALEQYDACRRLDRQSHMDGMTGLQNRNGFQEALLDLNSGSPRSFACVYMDANGLRELNGRLGHVAGDEVLVQIAGALGSAFPDDGVYRVGGDEFAVLCLGRSEREVQDRCGWAMERLRRGGIDVSLGIAWREGNYSVSEAVKSAEQIMRSNKERFYKSPEREQQLRRLDGRGAQMFSRQQDMETFLTALAPQFKGVYFVNLEQDTIRHLFIPSYFERILAEKDGKFSMGLVTYAHDLAMKKYQEDFESLCNYDALRERLNRGEQPELVYEKNDGTWLRLWVRWSGNPSQQGQETLWIFSKTSPPAPSS